MNIKKFCYGNQGPVILWGTYNFRENETEQTMETIRQQLPDAEYTVVAVEVDDWFRQFSPWPSDQLDSKFAGEAEKTWQWMEEYWEDCSSESWQVCLLTISVCSVSVTMCRVRQLILLREVLVDWQLDWWENSLLHL